MNISGIRPQSGFYNEENIESTSIGLSPVAGSSALVAQPEDIGVTLSISAKVNNSQTFGSYDYANQYKPDNSFDITSISFSLQNGEINKAVDNMKRDELLHQYQTFVVGDNTIEQLRPMENFSL